MVLLVVLKAPAWKSANECAVSGCTPFANDAPGMPVLTVFASLVAAVKALLNYQTGCLLSHPVD